MGLLRESDGKDSVIIFVEETKEMKKLPPNMSVLAETELLQELSEKFGAENVKVTV